MDKSKAKKWVKNYQKANPKAQFKRESLWKGYFRNALRLSGFRRSLYI